MATKKTKKTKHIEKQRKQSSSGLLLVLDKKITEFFRQKWSVPLLFAIISIAYFANFIFTDNALLTTDGGFLGKPIKGLEAFTNPFTESGFWYHDVMGGQPGAQGLVEWIYLIFYNVFLLFVIGYRSAALYFSVLTFVAGYFMYLFIRSLNIRKEIAIITGLFYMSSPMLLSFVLAGHASKMGVIALLPLMFLCLEKALTTHKISYYILLGGSISLAIGTAHLQFAYFSFWAIGFYFIYRVVSNYLKNKKLSDLVKNSLLFGIVVFLGLMIGARGYIPQYLHTSTVSKRAITGDVQPGAPSSFEYAASWSLHPEEAASLLLPHFGNYNNEYWGRNAIKLNSEYFGLYPFLLFFAGLLLWRTERRIRFFTFLFFFALFFALGANTPFFKLIYYVVPGVKMFRAPSIISFLFSFSATIVMALFLEQMLMRNPRKEEKDYLTKEKYIKRTKYFFFGSFITGAVFMIFSKPIISVWNSLFSLEEVWNPAAVQILRQRMLNNTTAISIDAFFMLVFCGILYLLLYSYWNKKIGIGLFVVVVGIVVIADTWRVNSDFRQAVPYQNIPTEEAKKIVALENLKELDRSPYRIFAEYAYQQGGGRQKYVYPGHVLPFSFLDFTMKRMDNIQAAFHTILNTSRQIYFPILNLMNVKYYITTIQQNNPNLLLRSASNPYFVYENRLAHPYFDFIHRYRVIENPEEVLSTVVDQAFSGDREVILEKDPPVFAISGVDSTVTSSIQDEIEYIGVRDFYNSPQGTFQFRVRAQQPGFVLLSNNYHPQWGATVDGTDSEIYHANYLWMGVFVPEGDHDVVFTFTTPEVQFSRTVSLIGMLIFGILFSLFYVMERRAPKSEPEIQG